MENPKHLFPAYLSVTFIWFSLQFGGGFSSGRQLVEFFLQYGLIGLVTPLISQFLCVYVIYYCYKYALENDLRDYREWSDSFYHPYEKIMSNVFEGMYNLILLSATAVALSTAGSVLNNLGLDYIFSTVMVAVIIFVFTIFGASLVRKASTTVSIITIISILVLFLPNIIHFWPQITANISYYRPSAADSFLPGMIKCVLYGSLQTTGLAAFLAHTEVFRNKREIKRSLGLGTVINSVVITVAVIGIFGIYNAKMSNDVLPTLSLAQQGLFPGLMVPLVSLLVFTGSTFAGVNLIFGNVSKIVRWMAKNEPAELAIKHFRKRSIIVSSLYITTAWLISQLGLVSLVKNVYTFNGILGLLIIIIPVLIRSILDRNTAAAARLADERSVSVNNKRDQ